MSAAAGIVIPYRESTIVRRRNLDLVLRHLQPVAPFYVTAPLEPWSPGAARNAGTAAKHFDPIVFNDADSICPAEQMCEAIRLATEAPGLVFAYDLYLRLQPDAVYENDIAYGRVEQTIYNSGSMACVAISRACFEQVGGFDESYEGWGYEDLEFANRCAKLWPIRRVAGPVYHLWHGERRADDSPEDSDPEQVALNERRWRASTV